MNNEQAERLASALRSLQFVEPVNWEGLDGTAKVLCRIKPAYLARWARIVERILKRAEELIAHERSEAYDAHICREYLLKDGKLVYGWFIAITSHYLDDSLAEIVPILKSASPPPRSVPSSLSTPTARKVAKPRRVPPPDAKGNPIVPAAHKVTVVPMAGLDPRADRNAPSDESGGKGAYSMFKSKRWGDAFKPPKRD